MMSATLVPAQLVRPMSASSLFRPDPLPTTIIGVSALVYATSGPVYALLAAVGVWFVYWIFWVAR